MAKWLANFLLILVGLSACNLTTYAPPSKPAAERATASERASLERPQLRSDTESQAQVQSQSQSAPLPSALALPFSCPDTAAAALIVDGEFEQAKALLAEDMKHVSRGQDKACVLLSLALLNAMPESPFLDFARAQEFRVLARELKLNNAHPRLKILDGTVESLIDLQLKLEQQAKEGVRLQQELAKKEQAIERLKLLTLGGE